MGRQNGALIAISDRIFDRAKADGLGGIPAASTEGNRRRLQRDLGAVGIGDAQLNRGCRLGF